MSLVDRLLIGNKSYQAKLRKMLEPLNGYLGINHFVYHEISKDDLLINLSTCENWLELCFENEYYKMDDFMVSNEKQGSGQCVFSFNWDKSEELIDLNNDLFRWQKKFDMSQWICISIKTETCVKFFELSTSINNKNFIRDLHKNMPIIYKFIEYLDTEMEQFRKSLDTKRENIRLLKPDNYFTESAFYKSTIKNKEKLQFLIEIGAIDKNVANASFSNREKQCIDLYTKGNTANDVANILGLSRRTVESHLDNLKHKFNVTNKGQLIANMLVLKEFEVI